MSGLAAIPADAVAVVGISVPKLAASPLVSGAIAAVLARDPSLGERIGGLLERCAIEPARDLEQVWIATGPSPTDAVLIAKGALAEPALVGCVRESMEAAGGELVAVEQVPRPLYVTVDATGRRAVWFAFGSADTVVAAPTEAWLRAALGDGAKIESDTALMAVLERTDREAAVWAAGRVDPKVGQGLVRVTGGSVTAPPAYMFGHLRVSDGIDARLAAVMASPADAREVARFARPQLESLAVMAQGVGLGATMSQIGVRARKDTVFLRLQLSPEQVKELVSRIDTAAAAE